MKVAVVTTHPIQYQVPWFQRLRARGLDLHVFFAMLPDTREQGREFEVAFSWDVPLLAGYPYTVMANAARRASLTEFAGCDTPQIYRELRDGGFDAVIVNGWVAKTCVQALLACRLSGIPCIVRAEVNGLRPRAAWKRVGHRLLMRQYSAFLAIGRNNRDYYLGAGVDARRIFDAPYCVDNDRFAEASRAALRDHGRAALRKRFGLREDAPTFLFSGKFVAKKRPADLIEACRLGVTRGTNLQVLMVGAGPLEAELRSRAEGLPIAFAGFLNQSEIPAAYAAADAIVLPSDHGETWGLVVNEAMACGLPAFVSDQVGCATDLVQPGSSGAIHPCGDVEALAQSMMEAAENPASLAAMGAAARALVVGRYNYDAVMEGTCSALEFVTGR